MPFISLEYFSSIAFSLFPSPSFTINLVTISRLSSLNDFVGSPGVPPALVIILFFKSSMYLNKSPEIFWAFCAMGNHFSALSFVAASLLLASRDLRIVSVERFTVLLVFSKLRLTVLKALRISDDTLSANNAVSTKYMILIIFCRGSLGKAMTIYGFVFINDDCIKSRIRIPFVLAATLHGSKHVSINTVQAAKVIC